MVLDLDWQISVNNEMQVKVVILCQLLKKELSPETACDVPCEESCSSESISPLKREYKAAQASMSDTATYFLQRAEQAVHNLTRMTCPANKSSRHSAICSCFFEPQREPT